MQEQDAPLKNTDRAFVKVGEDGSPVIPTQNEGTDKEETQDEDNDSTLGIP